MWEYTSVEDDDIRVVKSHAPIEYDAIAVVYRIAAKRRFPLFVRLVEELPENVSVADVDFRPQPGDVSWTSTADGESLALEAKLRPGEEVTIRFTLGQAGMETDAFFSTPPTIEHAFPLVRRRSTATEAADEAGDPRTEPMTTRSTTQSDRSSASRSTRGETNQEEPAEAPTTVTGTLAEELSTGAVEESDIAILRDHLKRPPTESLTVQQRYLQSKITEFAAFADEFARFLDAAGHPLEIVKSLEGRLDRIAHRLDDTERELQALHRITAEHDDQFEELDTELATYDELSDDIVKVHMDMLNLRDWIDLLDTKHEERGRKTREELDQLREWRSRLETAFGSIERQLCTER